MSIQQYALLDGTQSVVLVAPVSIDSAIYAAWVAAGNPKSTFFRILNMIAQPGFNPATQYVYQNGWTVTGVDVQPVWIIGTMSGAQQTAYANSQDWATAQALNIVTMGKNAIANWATFTPTQKDTVLLTVVKTVVAMLEYQFGINN